MNYKVVKQNSLGNFHCGCPLGLSDLVVLGVKKLKMWALGFAVLVTVRGRKLKNLGSRGWFEFLVSGLTVVVVVATSGVVGKSNSDLGLFENLPAGFVATVVVVTVVEIVVVGVVVVVAVVVVVVVFACNILGFGKGFFKITTSRLVVAFFLLPNLIFITKVNFHLTLTAKASSA